MPTLRFARNCIDAESTVAARCPCCDAIKLLICDGQDRVRAIADFTADDLRGILADYEAGTLPPFNPVQGGAGKPH
jgi:hypothetical protein